MEYRVPLAKPAFPASANTSIEKILRSGRLAAGAEVHRFERHLVKEQGGGFAIAASSGTSALHTALASAGIKKGDAVLTTPFSFVATANAILFCGARPLFSDIHPRTFNLDPESAEKSIRKAHRLKAILPVHLYGLPCDLEAFQYLSKRYGLLLVEDCAQAQGAFFRGRPVGAFGETSAFSFYATKNLGIGEGGAVLTQNRTRMEIARSLINHGRSHNETYVRLGYNYRMTEIQAHLGLALLSQLRKIVQARRKNAQRLDAALQEMDWIQTPFVPRGVSHAYHLYTIRVSRGLRERLRTHLKRRLIETAIYYPRLIYEQPYWRDFSDGKREVCPHGALATQEVLSLPVHPQLTSDETRRIIRAFQSFKR